ncbi:MAG: hypothetical protein Q9208_004323 [Pyrenodesmia sp. 3 TL-2023]
MAIYSASPGPLRDLIRTIPFDWRAAPTIGLKALRRSESRFHWFDEAKDRTPGLGTLGYLPIEVRHMIYTLIIQAVEEDLRKHRWCFDPVSDMHDVFFMPYNGARHKDPFESERTSHDIAALLAASGIIQSEIQKLHLSTVVMKLYSPLDHPFRSLSIEQTALVGRIAIDLLPGNNDDLWIGFLRQNLLPNLKSIVLRLGHDHGQVPYLKRLSDLATFQYCSGEPCKSGLAKTKAGGMRCKHVQKLFMLAKRLRQDLTVYEVTARILARNVPNAAIQQAPRPEHCSMCYKHCGAILQHAEKHSDEWLVPTLDTTFKWQDLEKIIPSSIDGYDLTATPELMRREHLKYFKA